MQEKSKKSLTPVISRENRSAILNTYEIFESAELHNGQIVEF